MSSAYTSAFGGVEPKYTTWKIREDGEHKQILDYIFHSKDRLQVSIFDNCRSRLMLSLWDESLH